MAQLRTVGKIALLAGFAASCVSPLSQAEVKAQLATAAASLPGISKSRRLVTIYAETRMAAWALLAEAKAEPESSAQSRQLGHRFRRGERYRVDYVVGGPYPALSEQIVRNALKLNAGRNLRGLRIVFVSPKEPSDKLRSAALRAGTRLEHRPIP